MPRHPPNALTSRLRIHTINNRPGTKLLTACIRRQLGSPMLLTCSISADDYLSQIIIIYVSQYVGSQARSRRSAALRHGIDIKNPFTMSKKRANPAKPNVSRNCIRNSLFRHWSNWLTRPSAFIARTGGASRDRTDDLKLAKLALSQLSYGPATRGNGGPGRI